MQEPDPWIEVVPAASLEQADADFERWLTEKGVRRKDLDPKAIRIDTGRATWGAFQRYWIRDDLIRDLTQTGETSANC